MGHTISHVDLEELLRESREEDLQPLARNAHDQRCAHVEQGRPPGVFQHGASPPSPQNGASRHELLDNRVGDLTWDVHHAALRVCVGGGDGAREGELVSLLLELWYNGNTL